MKGSCERDCINSTQRFFRYRPQVAQSRSNLSRVPFRPKPCSPSRMDILGLRRRRSPRNVNCRFILFAMTIGRALLIYRSSQSVGWIRYLERSIDRALPGSVYRHTWSAGISIFTELVGMSFTPHVVKTRQCFLIHVFGWGHRSLLFV